MLEENVLKMVYACNILYSNLSRTSSMVTKKLWHDTRLRPHAGTCTPRREQNSRHDSISALACAKVIRSVGG